MKTVDLRERNYNSSWLHKNLIKVSETVGNDWRYISSWKGEWVWHRWENESTQTLNIMHCRLLLLYWFKVKRSKIFLTVTKPNRMKQHCSQSGSYTFKADFMTDSCKADCSVVLQFYSPAGKKTFICVGCGMVVSTLTHALRLESQNKSENGVECALHLSEFVLKTGQAKDNTAVQQPDSAHWWCCRCKWSHAPLKD